MAQQRPGQGSVIPMPQTPAQQFTDLLECDDLPVELQPVYDHLARLFGELPRETVLPPDALESVCLALMSVPLLPSGNLSVAETDAHEAYSTQVKVLTQFIDRLVARIDALKAQNAKRPSTPPAPVVSAPSTSSSANSATATRLAEELAEAHREIGRYKTLMSDTRAELMTRQDLIDQLRQNKGLLDAKVSQLEAELSGHKAKRPKPTPDFSAERNVLEARIREHETRTRELEAQIGLLREEHETQASTLRTSITSIVTELQKLGGLSTSSASEEARVRVEYQRIEDQLAAHEAEIARWSAEWEATHDVDLEDPEQDPEHATLQQKLNDLMSRRDELKNWLDAFELVRHAPL